MQFAEIEASATPLLEMSLAKKNAELIIRGLQEPINQHLLKLFCVDPENNAAHWRFELTNWLCRIGRIRLSSLSPVAKSGPVGFYSRLLYDEPFGGSATGNIASHLEQFADEGYSIHGSLDLSAVRLRLMNFHYGLDRCYATGGVSRQDLVARIATLVP